MEYEQLSSACQLLLNIKDISLKLARTDSTVRIFHSNCQGADLTYLYLYFIIFFYEEEDDRAKSIDFEALCEYFKVIVRGRVSHSYSGVVTLALSGS